MADHLPGCSCCGVPLDPVDLDIRCELPDPVLKLSPERQSAVWGNRNFQQADGVGAFVRCLMPVALTGQASVTYSVWLSVHPDQLQQAYADWETPAYADLKLDGVIANAVKPWPVRGRGPRRGSRRRPPLTPAPISSMIPARSLP